MFKDQAGIYCLTNVKNNKKYIGSSKHVRQRLTEHMFQLENHIHSNKELQQAFDTDGLTFCILEYVEDKENKDLILSVEQKWINYYNSANPEYGYNKINSKVKQTQIVFNRRNIKNLTKYPIWFIIIDEILKKSKIFKVIWKIIKRCIF